MHEEPPVRAASGDGAIVPAVEQSGDDDADVQPKGPGEPDEIVDWPADALAVAAEPADQPWEAGSPLAYARAATPADLRKRRQEFGPGVGVAALALGITGCVVFSAATAVNALWGRASLLIGQIASGGFLLLVLAYVLGTIGRRSRAGRQRATAGRWWAMLTPAAWLLLAAAVAGAQSSGSALVCLALLAVYAAIVFCATLVIDAIFGTD